ncbi:MAG: dienelactone hydrolase family protein [Desulforhabdus sp.]|nr:dienelactone hydrolase family protein [Desulforhabdus sp.]
MQTSFMKIPVLAGKKVSAVLTIPDDYAGDTGIIMAHGAGNDMYHPMLTFLADGLAEAGYLTLRFNFLYREQSKRSSDSYDILCAAWESAYRFLQADSEYRPRHIIAAGKSLGGRIASMMAAEGRLPVEKLIFLGYPLHAPGKKDKPRDAHLYQIRIPMLFFAGTRDQLCDLDLLQAVLARLAAPWDLRIIEGGDHSFNVPKSYGTEPTAIYRQVLGEMTAWLGK